MTNAAQHAPRMHTHECDRWTWSWDESLRLLSLRDRDRHVATLPLDSLHVFATALVALDDEVVAMLVEALCSVEQLLDRWIGAPPWPRAIREALALLLLFVLAAKRDDSRAALRDAAAAVVRRLTTDSPAGAWYVAFQSHLPFAHRAGVLAAATASDAIALPDVIWWTAKCRLDVAIEWVRTARVGEGEAVHELVSAAGAYVHLLQTEPCRRAIETFFASAGTTSEREVLRAHRAREACTRVDEVVRAELMSWLLRRYALKESLGLLFGTLRLREVLGASMALILIAAGLFLFAKQMSPRWQSILQMSGFGVLVFFSPRIFSLMLPRALFGTLLAWTTVVLVQSASLLPIATADSAVRNACHYWLRDVAEQEKVADWMGLVRARGLFVNPPAALDFLAIIAACLGLVVVFLMIEVSNRIATRQFGRSFTCVLVMLAGSLFWGAMLVPILRYIIGRETFGTSCGCLYPSWILGSVCAVSFGILVQLMWDDRAISDSFGGSGTPAGRPIA